MDGLLLIDDAGNMTKDQIVKECFRLIKDEAGNIEDVRWLVWLCDAIENDEISNIRWRCAVLSWKKSLHATNLIRLVDELYHDKLMEEAIGIK